MSELNADASPKVSFILVTEDVIQPEIFWLNEDAKRNIPLMFVTLDIFQLPIGWLNDVAL